MPGAALGPFLARAAARGVDLIQVREKDLSGRAQEELVRLAVETTRGGSARVLVNDRLDVALASGADGVHLPAYGFPVRAVRRLAPPGFLIGVSTHTVEQAREADAEGADLLVFSPVFETTSKPGGKPVGLAALAEVVRRVRAPVFALGGVGPGELRAVAATGAAGVAGISAFLTPEALDRFMAAIAALSP